MWAAVKLSAGWFRAEEHDVVVVGAGGLFDGMLLRFLQNVNRCPVAGRVVAIERGGRRFLAAFNRSAETENVRCAMTLETAAGIRFHPLLDLLADERNGDALESGPRFRAPENLLLR